MFLATSNRSKRLLHLSFFQHVRVEELQQGQPDVQALLADLPVGFRLLTDLERLESMDIACATEIGLLMDLCNEKGVELVVRLVPPEEGHRTEHPLRVSLRTQRARGDLRGHGGGRPVAGALKHNTEL